LVTLVVVTTVMIVYTLRYAGLLAGIAALLAEGIGAGDHVGIYGQNSAEWLIAMMAA